jgi:hypothetical protein
VERENPSACATVVCIWCKWEIVLYCLYVSVIRCECVNQLLMNPIIRNITRHFSGVYHHTRHNINSNFGGLLRTGKENLLTKMKSQLNILVLAVMRILFISALRQPSDYPNDKLTGWTRNLIPKNWIRCFEGPRKNCHIWGPSDLSKAHSCMFQMSNSMVKG